MVTLSHPGRVGEALGDERKWAGPGRGWARRAGTRPGPGWRERGAKRKRAGPGRGRVGKAGGTRARVGEALGDEADPVHLRAPERGDAVP